MPTINVYLPEKEFYELAELAKEKQIRMTLLIRKAVEKYLESAE